MTAPLRECESAFDAAGKGMWAAFEEHVTKHLGRGGVQQLRGLRPEDCSAVIQEFFELKQGRIGGLKVGEQVKGRCSHKLALWARAEQGSTKPPSLDELKARFDTLHKGTGAAFPKYVCDELGCSDMQDLRGIPEQDLRNGFCDFYNAKVARHAQQCGTGALSHACCMRDLSRWAAGGGAGKGGGGKGGKGKGGAKSTSQTDLQKSFDALAPGTWAAFQKDVLPHLRGCQELRRCSSEQEQKLRDEVGKFCEDRKRKRIQGLNDGALKRGRCVRELASYLAAAAPCP